LVKADQKELNMQHAVHNLATIRVADRTDLSGRVTADEVNLDRFHNRIRKVCALVAGRSKVYLSAATMILIVTLVVPASAQRQVSFSGAIQGHEIDAPPAPNPTSAFGSATGIATHFGQLSFDPTGESLTKHADRTERVLARWGKLRAAGRTNTYFAILQIRPFHRGPRKDVKCPDS
jgi:hypothetical protein